MRSQAASVSASARRARCFHVPAPGADALHPALPLLRDLDVGLDPGLGIADEHQRVMMDGSEVRRRDLPAGLAHLKAEVQVVAVQLAQRLVEADVAHHPGRHRQQEPVQRVHLTDSRVRRSLRPRPREGRQLPAAVLLVALEERRKRDRPLPPGDAAHADRADAPDHTHGRDPSAPVAPWGRSRRRRARCPDAAAPSPRGRRARPLCPAGGCSS